jgi:CheY-like chemotaxis protein
LESLASHGSQKSDADRLIDAIKTPLSLSENNQTGYFMHGQGSKPSATQPAPLVNDGIGFSPKPVSRKQARSSFDKPLQEPGTVEIRDSKTRVKAVKVPEEYTDLPTSVPNNDKRGTLTEITSEGSQPTSPAKEKIMSSQDFSLNILVAEDDPINMKVLRKRLERAKHTVHHTVNGEDCATVYKDKSPEFDVVLMDMQVSC